MPCCCFNGTPGQPDTSTGFTNCSIVSRIASRTGRPRSMRSTIGDFSTSTISARSGWRIGGLRRGAQEDPAAGRRGKGHRTANRSSRRPSRSRAVLSSARRPWRMPLLAADSIDRPAFYIAAEKILGHGEFLPDNWPVAGTTGYGFLNALNGLFVDAEATKP